MREEESKPEVWSRTIGAETLTFKVSKNFLTIQFVGTTKWLNVTTIIPLDKLISIDLLWAGQEPYISLKYKHVTNDYNIALFSFRNPSNSNEESISRDENKLNFTIRGLGGKEEATAYDLMDFLSNL
jgi:hypothetical protein